MQNNDNINMTSIKMGVQHTLRNKSGTKSNKSKRSIKRKKDRRIRHKNAPSSKMFLLNPINNKPKITRSIRYVGTLSAFSHFDSQDIRCFCGFTNSGATPYYPVAQSIRLNSVTLNIVSNSTTSAGTVEFSWDGLNAPDTLTTLIVGNGLSETMCFFPPEGSSAWFWWDATSTTTGLFGVSCDNSSGLKIYLDINFIYIMADGASTSVPLVTTSAITGYVYRELPISSLTFSPVGLTTDT